MSKWKETTLGDIINLRRGHDLPKQKRNIGDVPIISSSGITGYHNDFKAVGPGVVTGRYGTIGQVFYVKGQYWPLNTTLYVDDFRGNDPLFVSYFLRTIDFDKYNDKSTVPGINRNHLHLEEVSIPPLKEQRAIASILSSLDDKIDLLHRQNKTLEAMAETLFREWFVEGAQEEWEEKSLGEFIKVKHGFAFKGQHISTDRTNQILVTPGNFKIGGGFKNGKMKYLHNDDYPESYVFCSNDLVVTMTDLSKAGDTLGYPALIPEHDQSELKYLHNQRVGKVIFESDFSKYFSYFLMKTPEYQWYVLGGASGTSIRHTSPTSICGYTFPLPPSEKMNAFDIQAEVAFSKIHKNATQIRTLTALRDTLLPKLMSGEVKVKV